jgi:ribosomal protein S18 acetylase RimI-like enzyme
VVDGSDTGSSSHEIAEKTKKEFVLGLMRKPWLVAHPNFIANLGVLKDSIRKRFQSAKKRRMQEQESYMDKPDRLKNSVDIVDICVDPDLQGKGLAGKLMTAFEHKTTAIGFNNMHLSVKPDNARAIKAYLKNGWYIIAETTQYIGMEKRI